MTYVVANLDELAKLFDERADECEKARSTASDSFEDNFFGGEAQGWSSAASMLRRTTLKVDPAVPPSPEKMAWAPNMEDSRIAHIMGLAYAASNEHPDSYAALKRAVTLLATTGGAQVSPVVRWPLIHGASSLATIVGALNEINERLREMERPNATEGGTNLQPESAAK